MLCFCFALTLCKQIKLQNKMKAKTLLLICVLMIMGVSNMNGQSMTSIYGLKINFQVRYIDPSSMHGPHGPRTPVQAPDVYLDDHTLYFAQEYEDDLAVTLEDENEVEVYSTYLYAGQTQLSLPSDLTGDYTLLIYKGNFAFIGEIHLE